MKITKKIWLLRICTVLYTAIFCIGCVAKGGVLQDVYASSANTVLVFAIIAVLLSIVGAWRDMLFLPIIVANTCIGIIQEVHSKKVLDKLSILNAPQSVVIREGKKGQIAYLCRC